MKELENIFNDVMISDQNCPGCGLLFSVLYGYEGWTVKRQKGKILMCLNFDVGKDFREYLGWQGKQMDSPSNQASPLTRSLDNQTEELIWTYNKNQFIGKDYYA